MLHSVLMPAACATPVTLAASDRHRLKKMAYGHKTPYRDRQRATIVVLAARGRSNARIADQTRMHLDTVRRWRGRFAEGGLDALVDRPRTGRPARFTPVQVAEVKALACQLPAEAGAALSRWSCPELAREAVAQGIAHLQGALDATVVLGALGPQMRSLGARMAEGLLLSWLSPEAAAAAVSDSRQAAEEVGRTYPWAMLYARTAVDPEARKQLEEETARYAGYPSYAANFARLGLAPADTTIGPDDVGARVDSYLDVVDELVLRVISRSGSLDEILRFVEHPELAERLRAAG